MPRRSTGSYPPDWKEIAERVKTAAGWKCVRCGAPHDPAAGYCLTVHHLDLNPANCRWWNLPALCQRCHLKIQIKVVLERPWLFEHSEWFRPYVYGYYAFRAGQPDDEPTIRASLSELVRT
jgi:5-methylcytosine-specific restriction endonuclease McrA